jgi:hypothetical protein
MKETVNASLRVLLGKTLISASMEGHHGDVLKLCFNDGTSVAVCTYVGTIYENDEGRYKDSVYVSINGDEIT